MSKTADKFDEDLNLLLSRGDSSALRRSAQIAELMRMAGKLRDLPSASFRLNLKARLIAQAHGTPPDYYGRPLASAADIFERQREMKTQTPLMTYNLAAALADLPDMTMRFLTTAGEFTIGVSRGTRNSHWERHPAGDELLFFLEGEGEVITLNGANRMRSQVRAGSAFVCERDLWHKIEAHSAISILFATPAAGTDASDAIRPPRACSARRSFAGKPRGHRRPPAAHDVRAALLELPALKINSDTTAAQAEAAVHHVARVGSFSANMMRYSGLTPWERHPDGDELLYPLEGAVDLTVLTDDGPVQRTVEAGSILVCPRGLWHRQLPRPSVAMFSAASYDTTQISFADDPRRGRPTRNKPT